MKIFDRLHFWKPKAQLSLEQILQRARMDRHYWPVFYQRLLTDKLAVLSFSSVQDGAAYVRKLADGRVPIFTSTERIFDQGIIKGEVSILMFTGRELFERMRAETFVINPYSEVRKDITPVEVESMLDEKKGYGGAGEKAGIYICSGE